jgi:hypothetical protein
MIGDFRSDLEPDVERTEALILRVVHGVVPSARLERIGPIDFDPPIWSCWVVTHTDAERDRLSNDSDLRERLVAAVKAGFPPESFTFQSEETVVRDYEGSWHYAMR